MGVIDTIILLLFLVFIIVGFLKGFIKQLFSNLGWIISLAAAFIFSKPIGVAVISTNIGTNLNNAIYEWLANKGPTFSTPVPEVTPEHIGLALDELGIPSVLHSMILKMIDLSGYSNVNISEIAAPKLALTLLIIAAFIIVYIIVFVIAKVLAKISCNIVKSSALGFFDGLLGATWSCVKVAIFVSLIMLGLSFVVSIPVSEEFNTWIMNDMRLADESFGVAKYFYNYNPLLYVIDWIQSIR